MISSNYQIRPVGMNNSTQVLHFEGTWYRFDGKDIIEFAPGVNESDTEVIDLATITRGASALIFADPLGGLWYIEKSKPILKLPDLIALGGLFVVRR